MNNSYSSGSVNGAGPVGGLIGYSKGSVINSSSVANVAGEGNVGGLIGSDDGGLVKNCYSAGKVSKVESEATSVGLIGGLVGFSSAGRIYHSFWDVNTSGQNNSDGGVGCNTIEMSNDTLYLNAGWDFINESENGLSEIWRIPDQGGYPQLSVLYGSPPIELDGQGTSDKPYLIHTNQELGAIYYYPYACYKLMSPINLAGVTWSTAVVPLFSGTFDGNGLSIDHLTIIGESNLALFGALDQDACVLNLGVRNAEILSSEDSVGILAGESDGSVHNCHADGEVFGRSSVGGFIGYNDLGVVTDSYSTGQVTGLNYIGGLLGRTHGGQIERCYSAVKVVSTLDESETGGLIGQKSYTEVKGCFWNSEISGQHGSDGGHHRRVDEMQRRETFIEYGWDFVDETENGTDNIWWILEGQDYPRLWWENEEEQNVTADER